MSDVVDLHTVVSKQLLFHQHALSNSIFVSQRNVVVSWVLCCPNSGFFPNGHAAKADVGATSCMPQGSGGRFCNGGVSLYVLVNGVVVLLKFIRRP